jgi:hypothetical protein
MTNKIYENPEPVPSASQFAVLPFLAAIEGFLREDADVPGLRTTIHRAMSREGQGYLQQVSAYVNSDGVDWRGKVGRTFAVNHGIMGAAYDTKQIWRTKHFPSREALMSVMRKDILQSGDGSDPDKVAIAYLAIPFLGPDGQPVLILYMECKELDFFVDDNRIKHVTAMCKGFCRLFDWLQRDPFPNVRNYPLQRGQPVKGQRTLYATMQECVKTIEPPQFKMVPSFNYEAAVA